MNLHQLIKIGLFCIGVLSFSVALMFARPSDATGRNYDSLIARGIIDGVATPHELGLDYLESEPVELASSQGLMDSIQYVSQEFSQMPENIALAFPLGTNNPIAIGQIPSDTGLPRAARNTEFVGLVTNSGEAKRFTPKIGVDMTAIEYRNGGNLVLDSEAQEILLADASRNFLQAQRFPKLDIIVWNKEQARRYIVRQVNSNAICRDAINSVLNQTLRNNEPLW